MKFADLPLNPTLLEAVAQKGYETATPIQEAAIPPVLAGHDLVGCAQTGTGKTAAFALPTLHRMLASIEAARIAAPSAPNGEVAAATGSPAPAARNNHRNERPRNGRPTSRRKTRTLVLAPTRELCSQITESFVAYGKNTPLRYAVIFGGVSQVSQVRALQHGVDVIIATPGRLLDLMQQGHVDLSHVETLILDEADRMLDMGFIHDLRRIVARVPTERQTLMFSATMPPEIRQLASEWLVDPVGVSVTPVASTVDLIEQKVYFVEKKGKSELLREWLGKTASTRTLVFARTKHGADKIVKDLLKSRIFAAAIHGNKSQSQREKALAQFKSTRPPVLVATDIAARGIDVAGISHVVNYDLPIEPETYVHRIGRTGRAGATGIAVSFCSVEEVGHLRSIERLTRRRIDPAADHGDYSMAGQVINTSASEGRSQSRGQSRSGNGGGNRGGRSGGNRSGGSRSGGNRSGGARSGAARSGSGRPATGRSGVPSGNDYGRKSRTDIAAAPAAAKADDAGSAGKRVERSATQADGPPRRRRRPQSSNPGRRGRTPRWRRGSTMGEPGDEPLEGRVEVVVIGAGAAGLLAATRTAERGRRTVLLEKNRKPGVKILMSGGTRCNLTHATDRRGIVEAFGEQGSFLHSALARLGPDELVALFNAEGVATKVEPGGKIFPESDRALDVLRALERMLHRSGAELCLDEPVESITRSDAGFVVQTARRSLPAEKVILTVGGQSYPGCGTCGDGYAWAKSLGHTIIPPRPALVPLLSPERWVHELKGVTVPDVRVRIGEANAKPTAERRGSFLFTHFGLSGPVVMDISRVITGRPQSIQWQAVCDFFPTVKEEAILSRLAAEAAQSGKKAVANILAELAPRRLVEALMQHAGVPDDRRVAELSRAERTALIAALKATAIPITGSLGFKKAEVTAGGVALAEVDSRTMQSKGAPNLYLAGEILDLDGPIGGYNFQAAFSTGWLAGESV